MVTQPQEIIIGVLALQGAFDLHADLIEQCHPDGCRVVSRLVKTSDDLDELDGIILPGGESTVMTRLLDSSGVGEPLGVMIKSGLPVLATCAGLILLTDYFASLDCSVQRNAYGRQKESFEAQVTFNGQTHQVCFIRAPKITRIGTSVQAVALHDDEVVGVSNGNILGVTYHPEVLGTTVFHEFFADLVKRRVASFTTKS